MTIVMKVDEETQGYRKEYRNANELKADLDKILDESILEVSIKRKGIADSNPVSSNN